MITYDILIPTIPHRHGFLCVLLAELDRQMLPGVGVRLYRDNLQASLREKNQALLESSNADYVSWLDDDDWLAPDYLHQVMAALRDWPDYVGFRVLWTIDSQLQLPVTHSLKYDGWANFTEELIRDVTALNPIRRSIALQGHWDFRQDHGADKAWAERVAPLCETEVFLDALMYYYRFRTGDSFLTECQPMAEPLPQLPTYPWLVIL